MTRPKNGKNRVLTARELNRALLARQQLLERADTPLPKVLEKVGGIQAQYAPSMYVGLYSRLNGFQRDDLTRALEKRSVVQGTLMRATIHLVSAREYWAFAIGIRRYRRAWWLRARPEHPTAREMRAAAKKLRSRLVEGPMRRSEIDRLLGKGPAWTNGVAMWLDLVRIPPSGTWDHPRADLYAAAEDWLGPPPELTEADGIALLLKSYLRGFGPAPPGDIANWTGLPLKSILAATATMPLRRFQTEDGKELLDLRGAPLPDPGTPAPVRFIPTWDATLLAHARRARVLPEEYRDRVFRTRTPHSTPTFLIDGAVTGAWKYERGRVVTRPFRRLDTKTQRELREEGERVAVLFSE